ADQVQRPQALRRAARPPQCLAVNGEVVAAQSGVQGPQPAQETTLEGVGAEPPEEPLEGVVRGDAVGQGQEPCQPVAATLAERFDLREVVGPGDDGTDGDDQDVWEQVSLAAVEAGVT